MRLSIHNGVISILVLRKYHHFLMGLHLFLAAEKTSHVTWMHVVAGHFDKWCWIYEIMDEQRNAAESNSNSCNLHFLANGLTPGTRRKSIWVHVVSL